MLTLFLCSLFLLLARALTPQVHAAGPYSRRVRLAWTLVVASLLVGCLGEDAPPARPTPPRVEETSDTPRVETTDFAGELLATPLAPARVEHAFEVGFGVVALRVDVNWTLPADEIAVSLVDPRGAANANFTAAGGTWRAMALESPRAGTWKLVVESTRALRAAYAARVALSDPVPGQRNLEESLALAAKGFAEVNFLMEANETVRYQWRLAEGAPAAAFNVHSHENGQVIVHNETRGATGTGSFTAPKRGVYSLLWENEAGPDTVANLTMAGAFRLHSQTALAH